jgi:hypothetical protein
MNVKTDEQQIKKKIDDIKTVVQHFAELFRLQNDQEAILNYEKTKQLDTLRVNGKEIKKKSIYQFAHRIVLELFDRDSCLAEENLIMQGVKVLQFQRSKQDELQKFVTLDRDIKEQPIEDLIKLNESLISSSLNCIEAAKKEDDEDTVVEVSI